ncbi:YbaB/EbfC family nucleoid-associated protein [Helicobacter sp. MIT 99-5507]|uniref:YbaB/EbfC family nucleoid-associated protein n=1 Tax=Helicobacter sp. MIT 99-5507 TaxID=152489 RepID=UPI000E1F600A|nr:YbaB/EbfC family nucleoid-associated protein [Helicobacter sp. MIT 99-5507]RDU57348.1 nucleoid-associated protein, YbaB/EbfC family [Helicobacter sp. MIT 99-5507]
MFNPNDLNKMLSQFQDTFKNMEEKQANTIFSATSGGGLIKASVNGKGELVDLIIDKSLLDDVESLQILIIGAVNEAYKNVDENRKNSAMELFGDISPFNN